MVWIAIGAEITALGVFCLVSYLNLKYSKGWLAIMKLAMFAVSLFSLVISLLVLERAGWGNAALIGNLFVFLVVFVAILVYGYSDEDGPIEVDPPM